MDNGIEEMAHIAANPDVAKAYNEEGRKNRKQPTNQEIAKPQVKQELEGVEDMAYIAAHNQEKDKKKSNSKVRKFIEDLLNKNKNKDDHSM